MFVAFIVCLVFVIYVYVGYPLILWLKTINKESVFPEDSYVGDISIVMVVCNEVETIQKKLENLLILSFPLGNKRIIVVDDASTDGTVDLIKEKYPDVTLITSPVSLGKANGINLAMADVETELVAFVDCRQEIELHALEYLASWFVDAPKVGAVSGELMFRSENGNHFSSGMDGYWHYEKFIRKAEAKIGSVPGVTGALYMLRVSTFKPVETDTLLDDVQIPMVCCQQGYHVGYDERAIAWDVPSTSVEREKKRKIRTLSGNYQLLARFPSWIIPAFHPIWWQFFSHKIARLIAPFAALVTLLIAIIQSMQGDSLALLYSIMFISGLAINPISYKYPVLNEISIIKIASSFITLNWFCVLAFFHYISGIKSGSWKN